MSDRPQRPAANRRPDPGGSAQPAPKPAEPKTGIRAGEPATTGAQIPPAPSAPGPSPAVGKPDAALPSGERAVPPAPARPEPPLAANAPGTAAPVPQPAAAAPQRYPRMSA